MSDSTNVPQTQEKAAEKPAKGKTAPKMYTVSQIAVMRAKSTGKNPTDAAKEVRARLRANFVKATKIQPSILKAKSEANDGNRWPLITERVVNELNLVRTAKPSK